MPQHVLVTGGAGYVGSHAAARLLERGYAVTVADDLSTGHAGAVPRGARLLRVDVNDNAAVAELFSAHRPDAVMHFASRSLVGESMTDPLGYLESNPAGALSLLRAMITHEVGTFILSSTANVYRSGANRPLSEDSPIEPGSPYGESKLMIERLLHWASEVHGLRTVALRYFNAAGASSDGVRGECHDPETHLIPLLLQVVTGHRRSIEIFGDDYPTPDGTCIRDYVHVDDLADAHILALEKTDGGGPVYNLGTGKGHSVLEVIRAAEMVTGKSIACSIAGRRDGDPAILYADPARARRELGWQPRYTSLAEIIRTAWNWHRDNPDGYAG